VHGRWQWCWVMRAVDTVCDWTARAATAFGAFWLGTSSPVVEVGDNVALTAKLAMCYRVGMMSW
jgi:hypothetical protein